MDRIVHQQQRCKRSAKEASLLCPTCHLVKTHDHLFTSTIAFGKVIGFGRMRKTNHEVYKGICLRCSTLMEAKLRLGEPFNGGDWISIDMQRQMSGNSESRNTTENINENEDLISQDVDIPLRSTEVSGITMDADLIAAAVSQFDLASEVGENAEGALENIQEEHEDMSDDDLSQHSPLDNDSTHEIGCNPDDPADLEVMPSSSEESALLSSVFKCASCDEVLNILKENTSTSASSVLFSLQRFNELLLHQQSLLNKGWPKILAMVASSYISNAQVQAQVFSTFRSIISVKQHQKRYISDFVLHFDVKKDVIEVMETHVDNESVQENACGLIAAIADVQKQALSLLRASNGKLVRLLMRALRCPSDEGKVQENALKALLRLSSASLSASLSSHTRSAFLEVIISNGNNASNTKLFLGQVINNIIHSMRYMENTSLQIHGARLLSNILESDTALREDWSNNLTDKILHHVLKIKGSNDVKLHEAFLCLLAKLSSFEGNNFGGHEIPLFVVDVMQSSRSSVGVALDGCKSLRNMELLAYDSCECLRNSVELNSSQFLAGDREAKTLLEKAFWSMRNFPTSASVHENACRVLACIFASTFNSETITLEDFSTLISSLKEHKNRPANVSAACSALHCCCAALSRQADNIAYKSGITMYRTLAEVVDCMQRYQDDVSVLDNVIGALLAICSLNKDLVLRFETDASITLIIQTMNSNTSSSSLQRNCIGVLWIFFSVSKKSGPFLNDDLVMATVRFLMDQDAPAKSIEAALDIIVLISDNGFSSVNTLLSNTGLIDSVVGCMYKFPQSSLIQGAAASVLSNVAINDELRMDFCHRGGTSRIIDALNRLRHDSILVCKGFSALSNLFNGADVDILHSPDANASESIVCAMRTHPQNLSVQIGGANALWALSARDKSFKDEIVALGGADTVAAAMAEFIGSKQLLEKCVLTFWSLSSTTDHQDVGKNTRNQAVGQAAIKPLVNGLSAHMDSEKVCMDGLCCMKCLSTDPGNKKLLEENGAVELIFSCLWLHSCSSTVCKEGLAALANISVNATTNEVSKITSDGLDAVVLTMRTHQTVKAVQESAIIYLRNSTFKSDNITTLGQNPYLRTLVQSARSNLDSGFQARADDVLSALR